MSLHKQFYQQAMQRKRLDRQQAEATYAHLKEMAYQTLPALADVEQALAARGSQLARAALAGEPVCDGWKAETDALLARRDEYYRTAGLDRAPYTCPACQDTGRKDGRYCACVEQLARKLAFDRLCADMPLEESTFETFDLSFYQDDPAVYAHMRGIFERCRAYAQRFEPRAAHSLLFLGNAGLGKTHLSLAVAGSVLAQGFGVVYGPVQTLVQSAEKERFGGENDGALDAMKDCDLLIVDDLGAEFATSFSRALIYDLVNSRLLKRLPVILNTNLGLKELEALYGARVSSRIIGNYEMHRFQGADVRYQKAVRAKSDAAQN